MDLNTGDDISLQHHVREASVDNLERNWIAYH